MGQQQLLLLVLSTVIVGLATVAGIQAFSENQAQATQDALVQRSVEIATDMVAAHETPSQMGGVDLTSDNQGTIASAIGISDGSSIPADGAGADASCTINNTASGGDASVTCNGPNGAEVEAVVDMDADDRVSTNIVSVAS